MKKTENDSYFVLFQQFLLSHGINMFGITNQQKMALVTKLCTAKRTKDDVCLSIPFFFIGEDYEQVDWV